MSGRGPHQVRVWDLPTRLFHWTLVLLMLLLFASGYAGQMRVHAMLGKAVLVLVLYRLAWGVVGSQTARFSDFVAGPANLWAYLKGRARPTLGHNPLVWTERNGGERADACQRGERQVSNRIACCSQHARALPNAG